MGKLAGFLKVKRRGRLLGFLVLCLLVSSARAHACQISPPQPSDAILRAAPDDAEVAAKGIIRRLIVDGPINTIPHPHFQLELQIVEVFKGKPDSLITVTYGPCHFVPGNVGETINVLARKGFNGELVVYY